MADPNEDLAMASYSPVGFPYEGKIELKFATKNVGPFYILKVESGENLRWDLKSHLGNVICERGFCVCSSSPSHKAPSSFSRVS